MSCVLVWKTFVSDEVVACSISSATERYIKKTSLRGGRNIVEASLDESSYSPHSIIGINEQTSPQGPEALWSIKALSSRMENLRERGNFLGKRMVVLTSSLSAIPCPCRMEEKNSTRGWLGCSSELCHKSNWTFLNICCGWLAPWLAEFDRRE